MKKLCLSYQKYKIVFDLLLSLSAALFTCTVTLGAYSYIEIYTILSAIFMFFISFYVLHYKNVWLNVLQKYEKKEALYYVLSGVLALQSSKVVIRYFSSGISFIKNIVTAFSQMTNTDFVRWFTLTKLVSFFALLPILFVAWSIVIYYLFPKIKAFFQNITKEEKKYLMIANTVVFLLALIIVFSTNAFTKAVTPDGSKVVIYDVLYTTDNTVQIATDSFQKFSADENDLRQPLFGLFAFPFGQVAEAGSSIFGFLPRDFCYSFFIILLQGFAISISAILLSRLVCKHERKYFLYLYSAMYATMFFCFNVEQYAFGLFWLVLLIYFFVQHNKSNPLLFVAGTGSLLTNGIWLPFIISRKNIKQFIKEGFKYGMYFLCFIIITGKSASIINGIVDFAHFRSFMGEHISFTDKLVQFIYFIPSCFLAPRGVINLHYGDHVAYQLEPITSVNILGIVLLVCMIVSFILNYKKKIAQVSFGWLLFSFVILCIIGWGTAENGLIIYGLYFSWAYFILMYLLLEMICDRFLKKWKKYIFITLLLVLFLFNLKEIMNIISFGKEYYPFRL